MKTRIWFLLLALLFFGSTDIVLSNIPECGNQFGSLPCDLFRYSPLPIPSIVGVQLAVHIIRYDDGTGGYSGDLEEIVDDVNSKFLQSGIEFILGSTQFVNSTYFATINGGQQWKEDELASQHNVTGMINIYFIPNYYAGGTATFTPDIMIQLGRLYQSIIIDNDGSSPTTLPHEMGHYFNLLHTFEWLCGYDNPEPSNCAQGQNSTTMGDLVDETPPDIGNEPDQWNGCVCTGCSIDYCPDGTNLMSYALSCRYRFLNEQMERARTTLDQKRPELHKWLGQFANLIEGENAGGSFLLDGMNSSNSGEYVQFGTGGNHIARTEQERFNNYSGQDDFKHHHWDLDLTEYELTHLFDLGSVPSFHRANTQFHRIDPVTIRNDLIDGGTSNIELRDPWWVDQDGNQPNTFRSLPSPIDSSLFLDQEFGLNTPSYSIRGPITPVPGFNWHFLGWESGPGEASFSSSSTHSTDVTFFMANADVRAKYKAHRASSSASVTGPNTQRRIARDLNGVYHAVYESGGEIWYTKSTDDGANWSQEIQISDWIPATPLSGNPSIAVEDDPHEVVVAWEMADWASDQYAIYFRTIRSFNRTAWDERGSILDGDCNSPIRRDARCGRQRWQPGGCDLERRFRSDDQGSNT